MVPANPPETPDGGSIPPASTLELSVIPTISILGFATVRLTVRSTGRSRALVRPAPPPPARCSGASTMRGKSLPMKRAYDCSIIETDVPQYSASALRFAPSLHAHAMNVCRVL